LQEPDGQPIRKANVQLNGRQGPSAAQYSAITDAQGQFTIDDLQPGRYIVVVERPGFVQSGTGSRLTTISVQPGSGRNELIVHMQPAAIITGKIVDLDGDPIGNQLIVGAKSDTLRDYFTKSVTFEGRDVADSGFPVLPQTYLDVVISANGASITGKVVDANGQPIADATVVDVPSAEHRARSDLTSATPPMRPAISACAA